MASPTTAAAAATPVVAGTEFGPDSGGRIKGMTVVKPIVVGNIAKHFGKKREQDGHTHDWTIYVKPYLNEDYSSFIKKVHFKLHDSYPNPNRIITKPPYEVHESGWGEFEVVIKIHFNDPVERPITVYHILKLFIHPPDPAAAPIVKKFIVSEFYDEIVFQEPTQLMKSLLDNVKPLTAGPWKHETDLEGKRKQTAESIDEARKKVKAEIQDLKEKLTLARETIDSFKTALTEAQKASSEHVSPVKEVKVEPVVGSSKTPTA